MAGPFELNDFSPSSVGPTALFVDTSAFFAYFDSDADEHEPTRRFFRSLTGESPRFPYRPLYTSSYVVDELATLLQAERTAEIAIEALRLIFQLADDDMLEIVKESEDTFARTREEFYRYDDQEISFTDHMIAVQAHKRNIDHVLAFDGDFRTLDLTVIPHTRP